jgi:hypothetical protein
MSPTEVEATVRMLADNEAIRDLARLYAHHVWQLETTAVADLFTESRGTGGTEQEGRWYVGYESPARGAESYGTYHRPPDPVPRTRGPVPGRTRKPARESARFSQLRSFHGEASPPHRRRRRRGRRRRAPARLPWLRKAARWSSWKGQSPIRLPPWRSSAPSGLQELP